MDKYNEIYKRFAGISKFYETTRSFVNSFPLDLPEGAKNKIINTIAGDSELEQIIEAINNPTIPRFVLFGRTGVGKSSLINALGGIYYAKTNDVVSCTKYSKDITFNVAGRNALRIMDTRGIGESEELDKISAETQLLNDIEIFKPHSVLFLIRAKSRDYLDKDIAFLKKIYNQNTEIPVIALVTQCDELQPNDELFHGNYSEKKIRNIKTAVNQVQNLLEKEHINCIKVLPISSNIKWDIDVSSDNYTDEEKQKARILEDYRYNINELFEILQNCIELKAAISFMLLMNIEFAIRRISMRFVKSFSNMAVGIAAVPIPFADIAILFPLQVFEIMLIAALSGEELNIDTAKKLIVSFGGATVAGFSFRKIAQFASSFLKGVIPGAGNVINAGIAYSGTKAIGYAAIKYFIDENTDKHELQASIKSVIEEQIKLNQIEEVK